MYTTCLVKNISGAAITGLGTGKDLAIAEEHTITDNERLRWANNSVVGAKIYDDDLQIGDGAQYFTDYDDQINHLKMLTNTPIPVTAESLPYMAVNRVPAGYTQYPTGRADNITNGTYGDGDILKLDATNDVKYFQLLQHWYAVGATAIWESAKLADSLDAWLICPATTGHVEETGDYNITNYKIIPVAEDTGSYSLDLTAKLTNTDILKCVPVPSVGNQGWFDYAKWDNVLTRNMDQDGGYDLYTVDVTLFRFGNMIFGRGYDGAESVCQCSDVVGKLIYNSWKIKFQLNDDTTGVKCGIDMLTFAKKNC